MPVRSYQSFEAREAKIHFNMAAIVFDRGVSTVMLNMDEFLESQFIMLHHHRTFVALHGIGKRHGADVGELHGLGLLFTEVVDVRLVIR
jgi:hypothetical protein